MREQSARASVEQRLRMIYLFWHGTYALSPFLMSRSSDERKSEHCFLSSNRLRVQQYECARTSPEIDQTRTYGRVPQQPSQGYAAKLLPDGNALAVDGKQVAHSRSLSMVYAFSLFVRSKSGDDRESGHPY